MAEITGKQSGTVTIASGALSGTATISAITLAQSVMFYTLKGGDATPSKSAVDAVRTNTTTLTFTRHVTGVAITIEWRVIEFDTDLAVQDLTHSVNTNQGTIAISSSTLAKSFILHGGGENQGGGWGNDEYQLWKFNSATEVAWEKGAGSSTHTHSCQVVEYEGCSVQELSHVLAAFTGTSSTDTISAVTIADTLLLGSMKVDNTSTFANHHFRADLQTTTTVRFLRGGTLATDFTINHFVVEFTDGTSLQTGLHTVADADAQDDITITAVTLAETSELFGSVGNHQSFGASSNADDDMPDAYYTADLTSTTNLQVTRTASQGTGDLNYQVIEWNAAAAAEGYVRLIGGMLVA